MCAVQIHKEANYISTDSKTRERFQDRCSIPRSTSTSRTAEIGAFGSSTPKHNKGSTRHRNGVATGSRGVTAAATANQRQRTPKHAKGSTRQQRGSDGGGSFLKFFSTSSERPEIFGHHPIYLEHKVKLSIIWQHNLCLKVLKVHSNDLFLFNDQYIIPTLASNIKILSF